MKPLCLIADDYDDIRKGLRTMLEQEGIEVIEAADGREALEMFSDCLRQGRRVDLAIIDHLMPHFKGDVVATKIRDLAGEWDVAPPIMFMLTGSKDNALIARTQAAGLAELYIKPHGIEALRDRIIGKPAVAFARG